jgi:hypothetical protein
VRGGEVPIQPLVSFCLCLQLRVSLTSDLQEGGLLVEEVVEGDVSDERLVNEEEISTTRSLSSVADSYSDDPKSLSKD